MLDQERIPAPPGRPHTSGVVWLLVLFSALNPAGLSAASPVRASAAEADTRFLQVQPLPSRSERLERSRNQPRAIVLLHGFQLHVQKAKLEQANLSSWQKPGSKLVQALAAVGDVYSFAYSMNVPVEWIARAPLLREGVWRLRAAGYSDIVLVGHSAGGLIARLLVEDHPDVGVTKVVQICAPNAGSGFGKLDWLVQAQKDFVESLDKQSRGKSLRERADRRIPSSVEFVCVIGAAAGVGDLVVTDASQWPKDLRDQGIPAVRLWTGHFWVTRNAADAQKIADIVRADHPRWDAARMAVMKKKILGTGDR